MTIVGGYCLQYAMGFLAFHNASLLIHYRNCTNTLLLLRSTIDLLLAAFVAQPGVLHERCFVRSLTLRDFTTALTS